jgi:gamma-glutamyltranspeptidase/glutathione hydrolase
MNVEAPISKGVFDELKARGHQVEQLPQYGVSGCATAVMIDPATGNRLAGADARRDCYAMAY